MQISRGFATRFNLFKIKRGESGIPNFVRFSNIRLRGKSYAASVPSGDIPKPKGRKRVSKDERRAMLETYVCRYREMNAGKFPSASHARNEVGGSYYVVKKIVQELEYNSKSSLLNKQDKSISAKDMTKDNESVVEIQEAKISQMAENMRMQNDFCLEGANVKIDNASDKQLQENVEKVKFEEVLTSQATEKVDEIKEESKAEDLKEFDSEKCDHLLERESNLVHSGPLFEEQEDGKKEEPVADSVQDFVHLQNGKIEEASYPVLEKPQIVESRKSASNVLSDFDSQKQSNVQYQGSSEMDNSIRDMKGKQPDDKELSKSSSLWGNLKSLADGFVNFWRKL